MARYINKDEFIAQIQDNFCTECNNYDGVKCKSCGIDDTIEMVENADEADVVPKSEVDEIVRQWKEEANCWQNNYITELRTNEQIKAEVAREIFEEIEKTLIDSSALPDCARFVDIDKIAELKKKYTEDNNDG